MAHRHSDQFKRDAARVALTSGLTHRQVSADLGVELSTLTKWVKAFSEEAALAGPDQNLVRENDRLRPENRILEEKREVLKNAAIFFADQTVRFSFIDRCRGFLPHTHLSRLLAVTDRGLRAWRRRPPSHR
jgi:transposase